MDLCVARGVKLDGDTVAILIETGKSEKPEWEPKDAKTIMTEILASRGVEIPAPRPKDEPPVPDPLVEERETEVQDIDEEERPL
jgi:hypothetical protein